MKKNILILIGFTLLLCSCQNSKKAAAEKAIIKQNEIASSKAEEAINDTTPPVITFYSDSVNITVPEKVDYKHIKLGLKAIDNIDGDISSKIVQENSTVKEHEVGDYEILYSVADKAGNNATLKLPVHITSKYPQDEEARLFTCIRAYNELKKNLKSPDSLRAKYITISLDGTMVNIVFSATNDFGAYKEGTASYSSYGDLIYITNGIGDRTNLGYEYSYDDLEKFSDYYYPKD